MNLKRWLLIDTGFGSAEYNMAVDEVLLNDFKNMDLPILRLYRWENSLSFGRFSKLKDSINISSLEKQDLSYVRRVSGGGVLIHGGDLSYSLIVPKSIVRDLGVKESYHYLCGFLIKLYEKLGLNASFASELNLETRVSSVCMSSNEAYDIVIDSKKIGGNAQRHTKYALFQHGSIPLSVNKELFEDIFLQRDVLSNILTLDKIKQDLSMEMLKKLILEAFTEVFEVDLIESTLSISQQNNVDELIKIKYFNKRWNVDARTD
jgi:lipoate-protein ligase A